MRVLILTIVLSVSVMTLISAQAPTEEQAPSGQTLTNETTQASPPPFPSDATMAYIDIQRIATESIEGQALTEEVQKLSEAKVAEIEKVTSQLQESQERLRQGQTILSSDAALQLQREIDRMQRELTRLNEDAEVEVGELRQKLQARFNQKLFPVITQVANDKQLQFIFSAVDAGLVWANGDLDLTSEIISQLDAASDEVPN